MKSELTIDSSATLPGVIPSEREETRIRDRMPSQIKYIVGNEAAERFSYYGMRSILVVFMVQYLAFAQSDAKATYHLFVSACYLLPLLGAFISDRFLGKYKTIMSLSIVYCAGHAVLSLWESKTGMYAGLGLIALGSGGIKPCVSAHVGDQFTKQNKHLVQKVFDLFYWMINFGAFFSTIITPWTLTRFGHKVAFGVPGILMGLATLMFWMGRKQYVHVPPTGKDGSGFMAILGEALKNRRNKQKGQHFLEPAVGRFTADEVEGAKAALRVGKIFLTVSVFWALFDQSGSSWVLQAQEMNLNFLGMTLDPSQLQALNPIMVMALIPIFGLGIYPFFEKRGVKVTPLRKMATGMYVAALSFVIVAVMQMFLDHGVKINAMWQFVPYLILTMAEILISITGLEFAYTQAPRAMKSTIMSFWLLTVFVGNLFTAYISEINVFKGATFFLFFAALMLAVSFVFTLSARRFQVREYLEG
jgi:POT family proton-dependent oligopeptide transporter